MPSLSIRGRTVTAIAHTSAPIHPFNLPKVRFRIPPISKICTWRGNLGKETYLFLDGFGDQALPKDIVEVLFGVGSFDAGYALAIHIRTGMLYTVQFGQEGKKIFASFNNLLCNVPNKYLGKVNELETQSRPFRLLLPNETWRDLWTRHKGYKDLFDNLVIELRFKEGCLQMGRNISPRLIQPAT